MKSILVCAIVGVAVLPCMAAETLRHTHNFGSEWVMWDYEWNYEWDNSKDYSSASWAHSFKRRDDRTQMAEAALTFKGSPRWGVGRDHKHRTNDEFGPYGDKDNPVFVLEPLKPTEVIGPSPVTVPTPGALVLAGLGTILVGTLRRRRKST